MSLLCCNGELYEDEQCTSSFIWWRCYFWWRLTCSIIVLCEEYKGFRPGDKVDSYNPDDLSDVSVPSDDEGRESILADISPASLYERDLRNTEIAIAIDDWADYLDFARKMTRQEGLQMKADFGSIYEESQTEDKKTDFWQPYHKTVLEEGLKELAARKNKGSHV